MKSIYRFAAACVVLGTALGAAGCKRADPQNDATAVQTKEGALPAGATASNPPPGVVEHGRGADSKAGRDPLSGYAPN